VDISVDVTDGSVPPKKKTNHQASSLKGTFKGNELGKDQCPGGCKGGVYLLEQHRGEGKINSREGPRMIRRNIHHHSREKNKNEQYPSLKFVWIGGSDRSPPLGEGKVKTPSAGSHRGKEGET